MGLTAKLLKELPGIINLWLDALSNLRERGQFEQPEAALHILEMMDESAGTVRRFVEEECTIGPEHEVSKAILYRAFIDWLRDHGHHVMADSTFGQDLFGLHLGIKERRHRKPDGTFDRFYAGVTLNEMAQNGGKVTDAMAVRLYADAAFQRDEEIQRTADKAMPF